MTFETDEVVFPIPQAIKKLQWVHACRRLFSANECRTLLELAEKHGRFYKSGGRRMRRDVHICYLRPADAVWAFERIANAVVRYNIWNFAISGIVEPIRIQRYGIGGYTRPHADYDYCTSDQSKITAIVPLVPPRVWSGGQLSVAGRRAPRIERGDCLLFPSFAWHDVSVVTRGERIVLSAWVAGPRLA